MKKVLVVGNGKHYFNQKLYTKLKSEGVHVDFFSDTNLDSTEKSTYKKVYIANIKDKVIPTIFKFRGGKGFYIDKYLKQELKNVIRNNNYDIIHLQGARLWALSAIQKSPAKKVLSVWGSDIYRVNKFKLLFLKRIVRKVNSITFTSSNTMNFFHQKIFSHKDNRLIRFGLELIDIIENKSTSYKKNNSKTVIAIGYNGEKSQQHLEVINSLSQLPKSILSKIEIVLPFTYGSIDQAYKNSIKTILEKMDVQYSFLEKFLPEEELALFRLKTDIMIQVQVSDQFSGSMQEHLYAGNIIITGNWLEYSDLIEQGAVYKTINNIDSVAKMIEEILPELNKHQQTCQGNANIIRNLSSWSNNLSKWKKLYH